LLLHLARQLDVDAGAFGAYARRDQTRRGHLAELTRRLGLHALDRAAFHAMAAWALPLAPTMRDPEALAASVVEELRRRSRSDLISYETERPAPGGRPYANIRVARGTTLTGRSK
jgi:hypothetical protein